MRRISILCVVFFAMMGCKENKEAKVEAYSEENQQEVMSNNEESNFSEYQTEEQEVIHEEGSSLTEEVSGLNIKINLAADQLFDFDKAILKPESQPELEKVFGQINGKTKAPVTIVGYTDSKGSDSYNNNLSLKRADAVKVWLMEKGLKNPISTAGKGAEDPIAPNTNADGSDNPDGRAKNRRVEIKVSAQQSI